MSSKEPRERNGEADHEAYQYDPDGAELHSTRAYVVDAAHGGLQPSRGESKLDDQGCDGQQQSRDQSDERGRRVTHEAQFYPPMTEMGKEHRVHEQTPGFANHAIIPFGLTQSGGAAWYERFSA